MKRMLAILGSIGLTTSAGLAVVACGTGDNQFNTFMGYVNETKGRYDDEGNPQAKSSASVIYLGAKDNGSSQSFQSALEAVFNDLDSAKTTLNQEVEVSTTQMKTLEDIKIENNEFNLIRNEAITLRNSKVLKVEIPELNQTFDGYITSTPNPANNYVVRLIPNGSGPINIEKVEKMFITGYQYDSLYLGPPSVVTHWTAAYLNWLTRRNGDRSIRGVNLNLTTDSKEFGKVSEKNLVDPVYGIKADSGVGLFTNALDYAKMKLSFKTMMVDKVSDYWNSDLFNKIADDYLKKDLMYQLTANKQASISTDKGGDDYQGRQDTIKSYLSEIKNAKGPLFLIVKNGHLVKMMKGWTRYQNFGGQNQFNNDIARQDLTSWMNEISQILSNSFFENNLGLFNVDGATASVDTWKFASGETKDDGGASNWDPEKKEATD